MRVAVEEWIDVYKPHLYYSLEGLPGEGP